MLPLRVYFIVLSLLLFGCHNRQASIQTESETNATQLLGCSLSVVPVAPVANTPYSIVLSAIGNISGAVINGEPVVLDGSNVARLDMPARSAGSATATGSIKGPNGSVACRPKQYDVISAPPVETSAPSCVLLVSPLEPAANAPFTISLFGSGEISEATINGQTVTLDSLKVGHLSMPPSTAGSQYAVGSVSGPGGTNACPPQSYSIIDNSPPPSCTISKISPLTEIGGLVRFRVSYNRPQAALGGQYFEEVSVAPNAVGAYSLSRNMYEGQQLASSCSKVFIPSECTLEPVDSPNTLKVELRLSDVPGATAAYVDGSLYTLNSQNSHRLNLGQKPKGMTTSTALFWDLSGDLGSCSTTYNVVEILPEPICPAGTNIHGELCVDNALTHFTPTSGDILNDADSACTQQGKRRMTRDEFEGYCSTQSNPAWNSETSFWLSSSSSKIPGGICRTDAATTQANNLGYTRTLCVKRK